MVEGNPVVWVKKTPMLTGWYYESDPDFINKYPQAEHDPEFMLEPHGDCPFKEMYRRPLYEGAGLTTVRSTEDAQRLMDHLLSLRYSESVVNISESPSEHYPSKGHSLRARSNTLRPIWRRFRQRASAVTTRPQRARSGPLIKMKCLEPHWFGLQSLIFGALWRRLCSYTG